MLVFSLSCGLGISLYNHLYIRSVAARSKTSLLAFLRILLLSCRVSADGLEVFRTVLRLSSCLKQQPIVLFKTWDSLCYRNLRSSQRAKGLAYMKNFDLQDAYTSNGVLVLFKSLVGGGGILSHMWIRGIFSLLGNGRVKVAVLTGPMCLSRAHWHITQVWLCALSVLYFI